MRFYIHAGTRINITETIYLIPKTLWMQQEAFSEMTFAMDAGFFLKKSEVYILGGLTFRVAGLGSSVLDAVTSDAIVATIGAKKSNYIAKLSYDTNVSSKLTPASNFRGGIELSFTYMHQKKDKKTVKICPQL